MGEISLDDIMSMIADGQGESTGKGGSDGERACASPLSMADILKRRLAKFEEKHQFERGMLVTWKEGMSNKKRPLTGEPAIVIDVLEEPVMGSEESSGSAYFREPLDLVLGLVDSDGDFVIVHYDSRRFEPWTPNP